MRGIVGLKAINVKPYRALFRIRFTNTLQYRGAALAGLTTQFAWGFMYILSFRAFYASDPTAFPMAFEQMVSYIWMQQAFVALFFIWFFENSIFESIERGDIAYELVRPMDLYSRWFSMTTANRFSRAAMRCIPILVIGFLLPWPFRLVLPTGFGRLALFFLSMMLSVGVVVSFSMLIYISAFYTLNSMGTRIVLGVAGDFLAGGYIPIPFFPGALRTVVELSPFGSMQNMPLLIFSGYLYGDALVRGLVIQVFWLVVLVVCGRLWIRRALKRVVAQGG